MKSKRILPLILIVIALLQACTSYGGYMYNSKKEKSNYPGYDIQEEISFHLKATLPEKPAHSWIFFPGPNQYTWILSDSTIIYIANDFLISGRINNPMDTFLSGATYNKILVPWLMRHYLYEAWDERMDSIFESEGHKKPEPPSPTMIMRGSWNGHYWLDYTSYPDKLRCGYISGNRLDTTELKKALSSLRIMENFEVDPIGGRPLKKRPITMEALNSGGIEVKSH